MGTTGTGMYPKCHLTMPKIGLCMLTRRIYIAANDDRKVVEFKICRVAKAMKSATTVMHIGSECEKLIVIANSWTLRCEGVLSVFVCVSLEVVYAN